MHNKEVPILDIFVVMYYDKIILVALRSIDQSCSSQIKNGLFSIGALKIGIFFK